MITIVDYGSGNLRSVSKALEHLGVPARLTTDPKEVAEADKVILPGVGAFGACVDGIRAGGFEPALKEFVATGRPLLGICVGMQILAETSEENPEAKGLGFVHGGVPKFKPGLKIPHMGWNSLEAHGHPSKLLEGIASDAYFYFVHSFFLEPSGADMEGVVATSDYGQKFAAVYEKGNVYATQFHPEKSQAAGLKLLENFASL